ncbi:MAG: hypothetical protein ACHQPI_05285 [Thermoanaerobaculia bacterium]
MAEQPEKVRAFVTDLLKKHKALTEREVKAKIGKAFKVNPKSVSAGVIREVRAKLGIDRPGALAFARKMLAESPTLEAKKVIKAIASKFGIRLGPPDVSRLRPRRAGAAPRRGRPPKVAKRRPGRPRKAAPAPAAVAAAAAAPAAPRGRAAAGKRGSNITVTYHGTGTPEALAAFFRSLST